LRPLPGLLVSRSSVAAGFCAVGPFTARPAAALGNARLIGILFLDRVDGADVEVECLEDVARGRARTHRAVSQEQPISRSSALVKGMQPVCARWIWARQSSPSRQAFAARSILPSTEGGTDLPYTAARSASTRASWPRRLLRLRGTVAATNTVPAPSTRPSAVSMRAGAIGMARKRACHAALTC
jgi:hypothetical protein